MTREQLNKIVALYWTITVAWLFLGVVASLVYNGWAHWNGELPVSINIRAVARECVLLVFVTGVVVGLLAADWFW